MIRVHKSLDVWVRRFAHRGAQSDGRGNPNLVNRVCSCQEQASVCEVSILSWRTFSISHTKCNACGGDQISTEHHSTKAKDNDREANSLAHYTIAEPTRQGHPFDIDFIWSQFLNGQKDVLNGPRARGNSFSRFDVDFFFCGLKLQVLADWAETDLPNKIDVILGDDQ